VEKLFTVAGTSRRNGTVKYRFSCDLHGRIPMLVRTGHTEIQLVELPEPMTREAAVAYLQSYTGNWITVNSDPQTNQPVAMRPKSTVAPKSKSQPVQDQAQQDVDTVREAAIQKLIAQKREIFPSFTEQQLRDTAEYHYRKYHT
jgi:hypothetical protein